MSSPERWARVQGLLLDALDVDEQERAAFLDDQCGGDTALRAEVDELLVALDEGPLGDLEDDVPWHGRYPDRVGAYRVVRPLAEGGMGAVLLAVREQSDFSQIVAIKLIRADVFDPRIVARFEEERRILARLEHPAVARLIDGGVAPDGRPFVAMEYVAGAPLQEYCDAQRLDVSERVRLFASVCDAVHYAHQQLVVHRDLKPSNILVTEDGQPKLLDFGIAKVMEEEALGPGPTHTTPWLTLAYASPEQVLREPITTQSDVYSLGVLLYELLAGVPPYRTQGRSPAEVQRLICHDLPPRPSSRWGESAEEPEDDAVAVRAARRGASPERLRRRIAGDLDVITLKALAKEPERRYTSAAALAEDLRRYSDGHPVSARPDRVGYRLRKFVGRNRAAVAAAVVATASLGLGTGLATVEARRAKAQAELAAAQRDRAEAEAVKARRVTGLLSEVFRLGDPAAAAGDTLTARELLDRGTGEIRDQLSDQPDLRATLLLEVARIYRSLGVIERAWDLATDATETFGTLEPDGPSHAEALGFLGEVAIDRGEVDRGLGLLEQAVAARAANIPDPDTVAAGFRAAIAWQKRARQEHDEARTLFERALDVQRSVLGDDHSTTALTRLGLAATLHDQQAFDEAERLFRQLLEGGTGPEPRPAAAEALLNVGMLRRLREDYAAAEPLARSAWEMRRALYEPDHRAVLEAADELGAALYELGRYAEASQLLGEAYGHASRTLGAGHELTVDVGETLANALARHGDFVRGLALYDSVFTRKVELRGPDHPGVVYSMVRRGELMAEAGQRAEAAALLEQAAKRAGAGSTYRALALGGLARLTADDADAARLRDAADAAAERLAILIANLRPNHRYVAALRACAATVAVASGRPELAVPELEMALSVLRRIRPAPHPDLARVLLVLGDAQWAGGQADAARVSWTEALDQTGGLRDDHPLTALIRSRLAP